MNVKEMQARADRLYAELQETRRRLESMKRERNALAESSMINEWARRVHEVAREKGWHDEKRSRGEALAIYLMNLHSEISECWEAYRAGKLDQPCDKAERMREMGLKPLTCLEEELADIVIRVMDDAVALEVDLEAAIEAKHAYNASRSHQHGGKLA